MLKPPGMTSHDVVAWVRRRSGQRRVGHTGTLDPFAAGVLVLCLGRATRLAEYLTGMDKAYLTEVRLGLSTDTHDITGRVLREVSGAGPGREQVVEALAAFRGEIDQVPPAFSALSRGGRRSYELARRGEEPELEPRRVRIDRLELVAFDPGPPARARLELSCSKGTYVRALARDLGARLGVGATVEWLLRTRVGAFTVADAHTLEELAQELVGCLVAPACALAHWPALRVGGGEAAAVRHGVAPAVDAGPNGMVRVLDAAGELLAVGRVHEGRLRLLKVLG